MNNSAIEKILPIYFEGTLSDHDKVEVEHWKGSSEKNQKIFDESEKTSKELKILPTMNKYHSEKVLQNLHNTIKSQNKSILTNN